MKFYSEIAKYYDYIFPTGAVPLNLMADLAGDPPKSVLDVACGTGGYSIALEDAGHVVTSIDLNEKMIEGLRKKSLQIDSYVLNMLHIEMLKRKFDLIFCIGNSLVHLEDNDEILKFLRACKSCLNPNGKILLQIVNYDRILDKNIKSLPTIENKDADLTFERYYEYIGDRRKIEFETVLKVAGNEFGNKVYLHPIRSQELRDLLVEAGFENIELYGNFKKDPYDPEESLPLIVTAQAI